ncbi:hypothetical protein BH20ACT24_BH20ACT24_11210 [soil metagenome]
MKADRIHLRLVGIAALVLLAAACGSPEASSSAGGSPDPAAGGSTAATGSGAPTNSASLLPATPVELPEFDLARFELLLEELKGTPVLVNVWASWCGPCRVEAPVLASAARDFEGRVQFLGVDIQDQLAPARAFIEEFAWPYPSVFDPPGAIRDGLGFVGQPVTVLYDRRGEQVFVHSGAITSAVLREQLSQVLQV